MIIAKAILIMLLTPTILIGTMYLLMDWFLKDHKKRKNEKN